MITNEQLRKLLYSRLLTLRELRSMLRTTFDYSISVRELQDNLSPYVHNNILGRRKIGIVAYYYWIGD